MKIGDIEINIPNLIPQAWCEGMTPALRDTSPNTLRAEQMKDDFNRSVVGINIKPDYKVSR